MDKKIILHVESRFLKGIFLKSIANADMDVLDYVDADDLAVKLDAFGRKVCLAALEINELNMNKDKPKIDRIKASLPDLPMLAVVSNDSSEMIAFAMRAGISDILLLPKTKALYQQVIQDKMEPYYAKNKEPEPKVVKVLHSILYKEDLEYGGIRETLNFELKRASRGNYPLTLVMAHVTGETPERLKALFEQIRTFLRDTDKVIIFDDETFIGVFPFTPKDNSTVIEQKVREAHKKVFGTGYFKKLFLFSATYPDDETELSPLLGRLENGINNSMLIDTIKAPFNELSKTEIEHFQSKIRQYRKFF